MLSRDTHEWISALVIANRFMESCFIHFIRPAGLSDYGNIIFIQLLAVGGNYPNQSLVVLTAIACAIVIMHGRVAVSLFVKVFRLLNRFINPSFIPSLIYLLLQRFRGIVMNT